MASSVDKSVTYPLDDNDYNWLLSDWEPGDNLWINVQGTYTVERFPQGFIGVQLKHVCEHLPSNQKSFAVIRVDSGTDMEELIESPMIIAPSAGQFRKSPVPTGRLEFSSVHLGQEFLIKYVSSGTVNNLGYAQEKSDNIQGQLKRYFYKSSWRETFLDGTTSWQDMAFGINSSNPASGIFVMVGIDGSKLYYLRNGRTWQAAISESVNRRWQGVAFGNNIWVVVGDGNTAASTSCIMTSQAPATLPWTTRTAPEARDYVAVTFGADKFVAISYGLAAGAVITSNSTGSSWTLRTAFDGDWESIAYGNGIFVVVGGIVDGDDGNRIMTSEDGITWTLRTPPLEASWGKVRYGNGVFIAIDIGESFETVSTQRVMRSLDGINWTLISHPEVTLQDHGSNIAYGNGVWQIAWPEHRSISTMVSFDNGLTWEIGLSGFNFLGNIPMAFGYGKFQLARIGDLEYGGLQTLAAAETE